MDEEISYAVFVKMKPGIGKEQEWRVFSPWYAEYEDALMDRNEAVRNPRYEEIEIRMRRVRYEVVAGSEIGKRKEAGR